MLLDSKPTSECEKDLGWFVGLWLCRYALCLQWNLFISGVLLQQESHNSHDTPTDQNQWECFGGQGLGDVALNLRRWVPHRKASFGHLVPSSLLAGFLFICLYASEPPRWLVSLACIYPIFEGRKAKVEKHFQQRHAMWNLGTSLDWKNCLWCCRARGRTHDGAWLKCSDKINMTRSVVLMYLIQGIRWYWVTDIMSVHDMVSLFLSFSWARPELILDRIGDIPGREREMDGSAGRKDQQKRFCDDLEPDPATGREWRADVKRQNQELNRYMGKKHRCMGASKHTWFLIVPQLFCFGRSPQLLSQ